MERMYWRSLTLADNYDHLGYPPEGMARDARYTRYVTEQYLLRTHTSAMVPSLLRALALDPPEDVLLVCPGLVYRRDTIDRLHTGEPHQLDLWRLKRSQLTPGDLNAMVKTVVETVLPGYAYRVISTTSSLHHGRAANRCQRRSHLGRNRRVWAGGARYLIPKRVSTPWISQDWPWDWV